MNRRLNDDFFLPHPSSPARRFSKITPVPSLPLKRGSTSPSAPSPQERAPTGKPAVLYSQTSSRPFGVARRILRNRVAIIQAPSAPLRNQLYVIYCHLTPPQWSEWHNLLSRHNPVGHDIPYIRCRPFKQFPVCH